MRTWKTVSPQKVQAKLKKQTASSPIVRKTLMQFMDTFDYSAAEKLLMHSKSNFNNIIEVLFQS